MSADSGFQSTANEPGVIGASDLLATAGTAGLALDARTALPAFPAAAAAEAEPAPRRFDPAALATADRLILTLLYGLCALFAVLLVRAGHDAVAATQWPQWRSWALLFPLLMALLPLSAHARFAAGALNEQLHLIGLMLRSAAALLTLQLVLWAAGHVPLPVTLLIALWAVHLLLCSVSRRVLLWLTRDWARTLRIVVAGAGAQGVAMAEHLKAHAPNVEVVGFIDDRRSRVDASALPAPFLGSAKEFMRRGDAAVDGVVIALPNSAEGRVETLAASLRAGLVNIYLAPEAPLLRRQIAARPAGGGLQSMLLLGMDRLPLQGRIAKRLFDIVFSALALIGFVPFGLLIALLIKLESPGPVIFTQKRFGLGNRLFDVYKFRSMRFDPAASEIRLTQRNDSRVTRIGDFLRRSSLDEFPQFLNVLLGHMSVVGPRPHPPGVKAGDRIYEDVVADFMERYKARPGITGWAQVNGSRGNTFTEDHLTERFAYDIQYLRHWSFELDLLIVLKTVWGGFGGKNAF